MKKAEKLIANLIKKEDQRKFDAALAAFYPNSWIADFVPSSAKAPLDSFFQKAKAELALPDITQIDLELIALDVRSNIKAGIPGNIEIQLSKGRQLSNKKAYPLGNSILKITPWNNNTGVTTNPPVYLFVKEGDTLDVSFFLGSKPTMGILAMTDENGNLCFQRLSEFHLFAMSMVKSDKAQPEECALMSSFNWLMGEVSTDILFGNRLDTVKTLLLADWLQVEWQKAKEAKQEFSEKEDRDRE